LAVLTFNFDYTHKYRTSLPAPIEVPLLASYPSFHRLLTRATDPDPGRRFESAQAMADQLIGVLREVLATDDGQPRPGPSTVFSTERGIFGAELDNWPLALDPATVAAALPTPQVDNADPAAGFLATVATFDSARLLTALAGAPVRTVEVRLRSVSALIEAGDLAGAQAALAELDQTEQGDWRVSWYHGLAALTSGELDRAAGFFDEVYTMVPGEAAAKLAIAATREMQDDPAGALTYYRLVWRTDHTHTSAAFGLARATLAGGDRTGAIAVLESVPETSSHYAAAQLAAVRTRTVGVATAELAQADLVTAADQLAALDLGLERGTRMAVDVLQAAHLWVRTGPGAAGSASATVLGCQLTDRDLRVGLERCYRTLARIADTAPRRVEYVDLANAIRPLTWV
jgi:serine/threonine-protein kinase PknG